MKINNVVTRIGLAVVMISFVLMVMAAPPGITITNPAPDAIVTVNYVNVTGTTTGTTGIVNLSWNDVNQTTDGSGNSFSFNKTSPKS